MGEEGGTPPLFPPNLSPELKPEIPMIPLIPVLPNQIENIDAEGNVRNLLKNFTIMMEAKVEVFVPLEIISDISIEAVVFGDQVTQVPFELELNREPEKKDFYKIIYSEKEIDIDKDGKIDTIIYSPEYANSKLITDNYVEIQGANITKPGTYQKKIYVTVEAGI